MMADAVGMQLTWNFFRRSGATVNKNCAGDAPECAVSIRVGQGPPNGKSGFKDDFAICLQSMTRATPEPHCLQLPVSTNIPCLTLPLKSTMVVASPHLPQYTLDRSFGLNSAGTFAQSFRAGNVKLGNRSIFFIINLDFSRNQNHPTHRFAGLHVAVRLCGVSQ